MKTKFYINNTHRSHGMAFVTLILAIMILCGFASTAMALSLDFGGTGQAIQGGSFQDFTLSGDVSYNNCVSNPYSSAFANSGTLTVTLCISDTSINESGALALVKSFSRSAATGTKANLIDDFVYTSPDKLNGMDITIADLAVGYYDVKLYLNDPGSLRNDTDIFANDAASEGGFRYLAVGEPHTDLLNSDDAGLSSPSFMIQADGTNDVVIRLMATYLGGDYANVALNGLELSSAGGFAAARADLDVDFGVVLQDVETGFEDFSFDNTSSYLSFSRLWGSELGQGNQVVVTVTEEDQYTITSDVETFVRTHTLPSQGDLLEDFVYIYGDLSVTLSDLKPGYYQLKTYHNDPGFARPPVDILITEMEGSVQRMAEAILDQTSADEVGEAVTSKTIYFKSDGTDVVLYFDSWFGNTGGDNSPIVILNGFELDAIIPDSLSVDIGETGQSVESGFIALSSADGASASVGYSNSLGSGTVTVEKSGAATSVDFNNAGVLSDDLNDDYASSSPVGVGSGLKLTVTGLADDTYTIFTNHNDPLGPLPSLTISVNGTDVSTGYQQSSASSANEAIAIHSANFKIESGSDLEVVITVEDSEGFVLSEKVVEGDFAFDGQWRSDPKTDSIWFDSEFNEEACTNIDPNSYDDMATWSGSYKGWSGNLLYMNFSSYSNKDYLVQEIDTAVEGTQYFLDANLGWRLYPGSTISNPDPDVVGEPVWDQGHVGQTIKTYAGIAIVDSSINLRDPNSCMDMEQELAAKVEISHTYDAGDAVADTGFIWVPTGQSGYTVTAGDAGKKVYVVVGGSEDIVIGCCNHLGAQAVVDYVSVMKVSLPITPAAVLNGLEIIAQNDWESDNHPAYCGDYGAIYLASDTNDDCQVNIVDLAAVSLDFLKCNDPTGDCAD